MKYLVSDHEKQSDSDVLEALREGTWDYSRDDLMNKAVMWFLYVEEDMNNKEIEAYLSKRVSEPFTKQDVTMSLRWWGLNPSVGKPLQARYRDIGEVLSFGWELYDR